MADTTFIDGTPVVKEWLNDVNDSTYGPTAPANTLRGQLASTSIASDGAGMVARAPITVATRTELKAVNTGINTSAILKEDGREGLFVFMSGDFASRVSADTQEGIYVKANAIASSAGAWVRKLSADGEWRSDWFGVPTDGASDCATSVSAMHALANIDKPATIRLAPAILVFNSRPTTLTYVARIVGSLGSQPTILRKNYVEADATRGLLAFTTHGFQLEDFSINASGAASGGSAISAILPGATPNIGQLRFKNISISMGAGANHDVYLDGMANTTVGTKGLRQVFFDSLTTFGKVTMRGVQHAFFTNAFLQGDVVITGKDGGAGDVPADDIHIFGMVAGAWDLGEGSSTTDYITRCYVHGEVQGQVKNVSTHTQRCYVLGDSPALTPQTNWDLATCGVVAKSLIIERGSNANGRWIKYDDGMLVQFGSVATNGSGVATVTWPTPFVTSTVRVTADVTDAPAASSISLAQMHTITLTGATVRSGSLTTTPGFALQSMNVAWVAIGV